MAHKNRRVSAPNRNYLPLPARRLGHTSHPRADTATHTNRAHYVPYACAKPLERRTRPPCTRIHIVTNLLPSTRASTTALPSPVVGLGG
jgi:hypothetical protein